MMSLDLNGFKILCPICAANQKTISKENSERLAAIGKLAYFSCEHCGSGFSVKTELRICDRQKKEPTPVPFEFEEIIKEGNSSNKFLILAVLFLVGLKWLEEIE